MSKYLDKLMNMMVHYLVRRNPRDIFKVFRSDDVVCPRQGYANIIPNAGVDTTGSCHLVFAMVKHLHA